MYIVFTAWLIPKKYSRVVILEIIKKIFSITCTVNYTTMCSIWRMMEYLPSVNLALPPVG